MSTTQYTELIEAVRLMRDAQKSYFKTRSLEDLRASKIHEARVDKMIEPEQETNQIPLFS